MEFSKDKDVQGEKELEMDTLVSLDGSSKDVITKRSGCMFQSERCCTHLNSILKILLSGLKFLNVQN